VSPAPRFPLDGTPPGTLEYLPVSESRVITIDDVPQLLSARGWTPRALDKRTWRCTVPLGSGTARIVVRHAGPWIYLSVMPFLDAESVRPWGGGKYPARFLGRILAVNANLAMVKFALDDDGDLALRVELPTGSLQAREFETALALLFTTTEQYRLPIRDALLDAGRSASQAPPAAPPADGEGAEATPSAELGERPSAGPDLSITAGDGASDGDASEPAADASSDAPSAPGA